MKTTKIWMLAILFLALFSVSCDNEDPPAINEAEVLIEYLESTSSPYGKYYVNTDMPALKLASHVKAQMATGNVYLIDIRKADDWAAGHIAGSVNMPAGDVLTHLEGEDLSGYGEIAIVCYSGQEAGWVVTLCKLAGYKEILICQEIRQQPNKPLRAIIAVRSHSSLRAFK